MKKKKIRLAASLFSAMFILTGCGTPLYEMTEDERDIVVHYAAYVVGKHNIYQKDGMTNADPEQWRSVEEESASDDESVEEETGVEVSQSGGNGSSDLSQVETESTITLPEAIGQKGKVSVTYHGCTVSETYQEGGYYSLSSVFGKSFLIMNFTIKNTSSDAIKIDAFSQNPMYAVSVDGAEVIQAEQTFLTYSLSTYQGKIESGKKIDVVLLFEVPTDQTEKMKDVKLTLRQNGVNYLVEL